MSNVTFDSTPELLEARNEELKDSQIDRENTLMLVFSQLNDWELLVVSLLHGLNEFGIHMSVTEIAKHAGRPRTAIEDFRKSAFRKLGGRVVRTLFQEAASISLTPYALAKESRRQDRKRVQGLRE